jgi:hypothetical protein
MERKVTLSDQQLFISVVEVAERPQLALRISSGTAKCSDPTY